MSPLKTIPSKQPFQPILSPSLEKKKKRDGTSMYETTIICTMHENPERKPRRRTRVRILTKSKATTASPVTTFAKEFESRGQTVERLSNQPACIMDRSITAWSAETKDLAWNRIRVLSGRAETSPSVRWKPIVGGGRLRQTIFAVTVAAHGGY